MFDTHTSLCLILASSSTYRRALLERLGLPFEIVVPDIDEALLSQETPNAAALRLARAKARAAAALMPKCQEALIIGSDQLAYCEGQSFGKPGNHTKALAQLKQLQGRCVEFHTGLCLYDTRDHSIQTAAVITYVQFRNLPEAVLEAYLHAEQPYDVAGSAKAEGQGIMLLESIQSDDPTALIGLPLITLTSMLYRAWPMLK
jgi:septum formation protein